MSDAWMPSLQFKLSQQEFDQLPRHPAYRYEYLGSTAYLSPWPRYYHAQLDLPQFPLHAQIMAKASLRPARFADLDDLIPLFVSAFARLQPFGSVAEAQVPLAAEQCLRQTFSGGDGLFVEQASFIATEQTKIVGAILITLLPGGDPTEWDSYHWTEPPPDDLWRQRQGQPHLTWIFVDRLAQGTGAGTQLLHEAVQGLREQSYQTLWTTFQIGNDSSLLWHWRNGFHLMPHALSKRRG